MRISVKYSNVEHIILDNQINVLRIYSSCPFYNTVIRQYSESFSKQRTEKTMTIELINIYIINYSILLQSSSILKILLLLRIDNDLLCTMTKFRYNFPNN